MLGNSGASVDSSAMRFMMVLIFALALLFYLIHGPQKSELTVFGIIIGFATLFYTTQLKDLNMKDNFFDGLPSVLHLF